MAEQSSHFRIYPDDNRIEVFYKGRVTIDVFKSVIHQVQTHADFRPGMDSVVDLRETFSLMSTDDLKVLVDFFSEIQTIRGACKWALVVGQNISESQARIVSTLTSRENLSIQMKIFSQWDDGLAWIKQPHP